MNAMTMLIATDSYRRDVGDTLINAYYVLRDDMLAYYVDDALDRLSRPVVQWEVSIFHYHIERQHSSLVSK